MDEQLEADLPVNLLQTRTTLQPGRNRYQGCEDGDHGQHQWLFILGTGRSGSTSILEMVNSIPGYLLGGENDGIMSEFLDLMKHREHQTEHQYSVAWHSANVSDQHLLCILRAYAREIIGWNGEHPRTLGFKEIRHSEKEELDLFLEVFPNARFIINTAPASRQAASRLHKKAGHDYTQLEEMNQRLADWGRNHSNVSFSLPLDEFDLVRFNEMLDWLGVNNCRYTRVAHANDHDSHHGFDFTPLQAMRDPRTMPGIECRQPSDFSIAKEQFMQGDKIRDVLAHKTRKRNEDAADAAITDA